MSEGLKEHAWKACVGVILLPWVRIPLSPPHSAFAPCGGGRGLQALCGSRRSGHESRSLRHIPHSLHVAAGVGFRRCAALAAPGTNPGLSATFRIRSMWRRAWASGAVRLSPLRARIPVSPPHSAFAPCGGGRGLQALCGSRRSGHESRSLRHIPHSLHVAAGVGFRRCAALAAPGTNPGLSATFRIRSMWRRAWASGAVRLSPLRARIPVSPPHSAFAPCGGGRGLQALCGSRRSGHESRSLRHIPHSLHVAAGVGFRRCAALASPSSRTVDRTPRAAYTGASARGDGSRRGSEPVQFQPTNRVRAGRQQR